MASERQTAKQLENAKSSAQDWESKAKIAFQAENEELARKALYSKVAVDANIQSFPASYDQISAQTAELRSRVEPLKGKSEEARIRQNMLGARARMADAQKNVSTTLSGTDSDSAFSKLDKMDRKIEGKETQAEAFASMSSDTTFAKD